MARPAENVTTFPSGEEQKAKASIWAEPERPVLRVQTPVPGKPRDYDLWAYSIQQTNEQADEPRVRIAGKVTRHDGSEKDFSIEWSVANHGFILSDPILVTQMGNKDEVLRLAKAVGESVRHGASHVYKSLDMDVDEPQRAKDTPEVPVEMDVSPRPYVDRVRGESRTEEISTEPMVGKGENFRDRAGQRDKGEGRSR